MMNIEFNTMLSENERLVEIPAVWRNCTPAGQPTLTPCPIKSPPTNPGRSNSAPKATATQRSS